MQGPRIPINSTSRAVPTLNEAAARKAGDHMKRTGSLETPDPLETCKRRFDRTHKSAVDALLARVAPGLLHYGKTMGEYL